MDSVKLIGDQLLPALEYVLSRPPARVGMRLRTDQELAQELGVSRWRLRALLGQLVERGILARRQGSGTYIRKVAAPVELPVDLLAIRPEQIFAQTEEERGSDSRLQSTWQQKSLHLNIIMRQSTEPSLTSQRILDFIVQDIEQRGHRSALFTVDLNNEPASVERLKRRIEEFPADGYLVGYRTGPIFEKATAPQRLPAAYFSMGASPVRQEPLVYIDTFEAITRGVAKLAEQGYQRIALLGQAGGYKSHEKENRHVHYMGYDHAMLRAQLSYRAAAFASGSQAESAVGAIETTRQLLTSDSPPDALLLADDHLLPGVKMALELSGRVPGQDIGILTTCNRGIPLAGGYNWSAIEFDLSTFARHVVGALLDGIERAGNMPATLGICGRWKPGVTHLKAAPVVARS